MQGTLNEIDIRSILQLIELGQRTGELYIEAYSSHSNTLENRHPLWLSREYGRSYEQAKSGSGRFWFLFCINGQIAYAADSNSSLMRVKDYLKHYSSKELLDNGQDLAITSSNAPEYVYLWKLIEQDIITPQEGRSIIQSMIHETVFDLFSLHSGSFIFDMAPALAPQLTTLEIGPLILKIMKQVQEWKQFHPHIQSPNQCLVINNAQELSTSLPANTFQTLVAWVDGKTSLRQISRYLNRDILKVAKAIYPYVQQGLIQLHYPGSEQQIQNNLDSANHPKLTPKVPSIVCIDDDLTIGKAVESMLETKGYQITTINDPIAAISLVFKIKPDLILCDIAMPELDGYEISAMLRRSTAFRLTPLIMLTGMDGFIDRVRARMVGATDYLTKPFGANELLVLMEKYLKNASVNELSNNDDKILSPPSM